MKYHTRMYSVLVFVVLFNYVRSAGVCDICVCRYNNKSEQDFVGEDVDCSYKHVYDKNFTLPNSIHSLDLSSNNISNVISSTLLQSKTMSKLILNNNEISTITTDAFHLPELRALDLSYNQLEFIDKDVFKTMRKLEYLNLSNNKLTTLSLQSLSNLNELILDNNYLGPNLIENNLFSRNGFGLTHKIKSLSISGVNLNSVPDNFFANAYDIRKLIISNNNLSEVFELPFTLEYLDLSDNPIEEITGEDFSELPALKVLKLNNLLITEVPGYTFSSSHALLQLELERNMNLTVFSQYAFGHEVLDDADDFLLEELSLKGSRLTKLNKTLIEPFGKLVRLDLQGNPWHCDCKLLWLKKLQIPPKDYDHLRCNTPAPFYNSKIFELDSKYFKCAKVKTHGADGVIAVVSVCAILAVLAVWIFVYMPGRQSRSAFINSMPTTAYTVLPTIPSSHDL